MKKIIKLIIVFIILMTSTTFGYSEWLIAVNNGENITSVVRTSKEPVCYNKRTGIKYS